MIRVPVALGERSYDVLIGHGASAELVNCLPRGARRAVIVTQSGIPLPPSLPIPSEVVEIGHGEEHKTLATIEALTRRFATMRLSREDVVVGVGGGMVTDVAGFAASCWHRGTPVVHVATSLLAMVDAAIGGKTGVNLPEGKNLVGAFWQPSAVICDLDALATLPARELRCGYGEMAKYHFLGGEDIDELGLAERVARSVQLKAEFVAADEREGGRRALLNYGHTLAHALETATGHRLAHGEAVAVGLVFAAHLARELGRIDDGEVARHERVVAAYSLDARLPAGLDDDRLVELIGRDKKVLGGGLTFVLLGPRGPEVVGGVHVEAVRAALARHRGAGER